MILDLQSSEITHESDATPAQAMGKRAENREVQIQRILEASKKCFVRSGFRGASMHEICGEAGMSPGALYRYFPSKESIIEAISESHRREELAILATMGQGPTVIDGFMSAIMAHMRHVHETGMGPLFTEIRAESLRNETVRNCCQKSEGQFMEAFAAFIEVATDQGLINPVAENKTLIPVMMAVGEGIIFSDLPDRGVDLDKLEPILRHLTESFLRPVAPNSLKKEA